MVIHIVICIFIVWLFIYIVFSIKYKITKSDKKIIENYNFIGICIFTIPVVVVGYIVILLHLMFPSKTDLVDENIQYGNYIASGYADGLTYTDCFRIYDNGTFDLYMYNIQCNGYYELAGDTIFLCYNQNYDDTILPNLFIRQGKGLYGYWLICNQLDTSRYAYLSYHSGKK